MALNGYVFILALHIWNNQSPSPGQELVIEIIEVVSETPFTVSKDIYRAGHEPLNLTTWTVFPLPGNAIDVKIGWLGSVSKHFATWNSWSQNHKIAFYWRAHISGPAIGRYPLDIFVCIYIFQKHPKTFEVLNFKNFQKERKWLGVIWTTLLMFETTQFEPLLNVIVSKHLFLRRHFRNQNFLRSVAHWGFKSFTDGNY